MRVVLFIGNGFDKALGLKTGYEEFFRDWITTPADFESCKHYRLVTYDLQQIFRQRQCAHFERWSDFEEALGTLNYFDFRCIDGDARLYEYAIQNTVSILSSSLSRYLVQQQDAFKIIHGKEANVRTILIEAIMHALRLDMVRGLPGEEIFLSCVTLNYTDSLEKILLLDQSDACAKLVLPKVHLSGPIHVHGSLGKGIVFGIDNMEQFFQPLDLGATYERCRNQLCKGSWRNSATCDTAAGEINNADVVLTYGISWGVTDLYWWQIMRHSLNEGSKRLCVCPYAREMKTMQLSQFEELWKKERDTALNAMGVIGKEREELASRIMMPHFESKRQNGFCIDAGDFLGLDAIRRCGVCRVS